MGLWKDHMKIYLIIEALQLFNVGTKVDWLFKEYESGGHLTLEIYFFFTLVMYSCICALHLFLSILGFSCLH